MKRLVYIFSAGVLGLILSTIVRGIIEMFALKIIFNQPELFVDTVWWQQWPFIHGVASVALWLLGLAFGIYFGRKWWEPYGSKPWFYHWRKMFVGS